MQEEEMNTKKQSIAESNQGMEKKLYKSGEIHRSNRDNSTFYDDENLKLNKRSNRTSYEFNSGKKPKKTQSMFFSTISQNLNNVRLPGMSEFQSTNSMQNSSYIWTFSKAHRFSSVYKRPATDSIYTVPDWKSGRYTTQGFGNKYDLRPLQGRNSPPPNTYRIKSCFEINAEKKKGPLIHNKIPGLAASTSKYPGPGAYNVRKSVELTKGSPVTIKSRTMFFYDEDLAKQKHCLSPQKYFPSTKIVENGRYTTIGFGLGGRSANENTSVLKIPGPGTYNLPSVFDKNRKYRVPLN